VRICEQGPYEPLRSLGRQELAISLCASVPLRFSRARLLIPEHFGLVMMVSAVTAIADQFSDLGLSTATVQKETVSYEEVTNLFWINVLAGLFIAGVIFASVFFQFRRRNRSQLA
jgi:PST family polysaccharide transporter